MSVENILLALNKSLQVNEPSELNVQFLKIYKWWRIFEAERNSNFDTRNIKQIDFRERERRG